MIVKNQLLDFLTTNDYNSIYGKESKTNQYPPHVSVRSKRPQVGSANRCQLVGYDRNTCEGRGYAAETSQAVTHIFRKGGVQSTAQP